MENFDSFAVFSVDSRQSQFCKGTVIYLSLRLCVFAAGVRAQRSKKPAERGSTGFSNLCFKRAFGLGGRQLFQLGGEARDLARAGVLVDDAL